MDIYFSLDVCRRVEIEPRQPRECSGSSERPKDLNFWYVLAWLLPLGLCRLKHLPREWVMSSFITALVAMGFTAYHNSARDAGPAVVRPIFSIAGPLLSVSVALLIVDLAERQSCDKL